MSNDFSDVLGERRINKCKYGEQEKEVDWKVEGEMRELNGDPAISLWLFGVVKPILSSSLESL